MGTPLRGADMILIGAFAGLAFGGILGAAIGAAAGLLLTWMLEVL